MQELKSQIITPGSFQEEYTRLLYFKNYSDVTPIAIYPSITYFDAITDSIDWNIWNENFQIDEQSGFRINSVELLNSYNSSLPWSYNDGAYWQGKGHNMAVKAGVSFSSKYIDVTINPILFSASNQAYTIPDHSYPKSSFSYPLNRRIDFVQRYGNERFNAIDWGQAEVRFKLKRFTTGVTTQNMSWGPAYYNPIIMSKNASGIPRIFMGTDRPIHTKIGSFEAYSIWGLMSESAYFDTDNDNDLRYIGGLTFGYRPSFAESLSVGLARVSYRNRFGLDFRDLFVQFFSFNSDYDEEVSPGVFTNDFNDQMLSVFATWTFAEQGFEAYFEFAKNDFPGGFLEFVRYPDRARAYTLGFTKLFELANKGVIKLNYEGTQLASNQVRLVTGSGNPIFYLHHIVDQGYTQNGQFIGAGIGIGSNANTLTASYFGPNSQFGLDLNRTRFNDEYLVRNFSGLGTAPTEYEWRVGVHYLRHFERFTSQIRMARIRHLNVFFDDDRGAFNWNFQLNLEYRLSSN